MDEECNLDLSEFNDTNHVNKFLDSAVPKDCLNSPCILGIDEAGRGPVLGPMVYGATYCPLASEERLKGIGAADSKTLTDVQRDILFKKINESGDFIGWAVKIISPLFISNNMYKRPKVSLNEISENAAAELIQRVQAAGVNLEGVFLDTVGPPEKYQAKLQSIFPSVKITVSKKADSLFAVVSAASICAKVIRDRALKEWKFPEGLDLKEWGSGYPGDSVTKNFLMNSLDPVFGFPGIVRFSWSTAEKILEDKGIPVSWNDYEAEEKKEKESTPSLFEYFARKDSRGDIQTGPDAKRRRRHHFFEARELKIVESL